MEFVLIPHQGKFRWAEVQRISDVFDKNFVPLKLLVGACKAGTIDCKTEGTLIIFSVNVGAQWYTASPFVFSPTA